MEVSVAAMNYMAMVGWKTVDMLDGIEGIMNLAAASGKDLATTLDIVMDKVNAESTLEFEMFFTDRKRDS